MVHYRNESVLESFDQFAERCIIIVANPEHQTDVRVSQGHLSAGITNRHASGSPSGRTGQMNAKPQDKTPNRRIKQKNPMQRHWPAELGVGQVAACRLLSNIP
jgi:hypothetical protein